MHTQDNYIDLYELADQYYAKGLLEKSEELIIATLKENPGFAPAFQLLAQITEDLGFADDALVFHRFRASKYISLPERLRKKYFKYYVNRTNKTGPVSVNYEKTRFFDGESTDLGLVSPSLKVHTKYFKKTALGSDPAYLYSIPGGSAWIDGFNQVVWDSAGNIIPQLCRGHVELIDSIVSKRNPVQLQSRVGVIANRNNGNYYHWLTDVAPALSLFSSAGFSPELMDYYISNPIITDFQREVLDIYNIPTSKQILHDEQTYIQADELIIATWGSNTMGVNVGSWVSEEFKHRFQCESSDNSGDSEPRLYISRGNSETRRILNEPELTELLTNRYGFKVVDTLDYSVKEQARLFANAQCILAAHGAALTNIHFCTPGTSVIEIFGNYVDPCFWVLCNRIGLNHHFHQPDLYQSAPKCPKGIGERRKMDITVDITELDRQLRLWL